MAAVDVRASLLGEQGRKPALQEVQGLLASVQTYLQDIASEHPRYASAIRRSTTDINMYISHLEQGLGEANRFLAQDSLICAYLNALKKQDWLAHKPCLPQALSTLWMGDIERRQALQEGLKPLHSAVTGLDTMLHNFVDWKWCRADEGNDQIQLDRDASFGLLVIGLDPSVVQTGIVPDISRNRFMAQLRFQHWRPGSSPCSATMSIPYAMMLVPVV
ncbi:MAG: hypothetical protein ACE5DY_03045 [Mariprofundaceae bacterium]